MVSYLQHRQVVKITGNPLAHPGLGDHSEYIFYKTKTKKKHLLINSYLNHKIFVLHTLINGLILKSEYLQK